VPEKICAATRANSRLHGKPSLNSLLMGNALPFANPRLETRSDLLECERPERQVFLILTSRSVNWSKDIDQTLVAAKEQSRPILLDFSAAPA